MVSVHNDGFKEYNKWWWWWYCHSFCAVLKLIYHHSVSDFNMGPRMLHTRLQPERHRLNVFLKKPWRTAAKESMNCCSSLSTLGPTPQKERTWSNKGTWRKPFCWYWMHNPQTRKTFSHSDCRHLTLNGCTS